MKQSSSSQPSPTALAGALPDWIRDDTMTPIEVGTSWRIKLADGTETGWYTSRKKAVEAIDKISAARVRKEHRTKVLTQLRAEAYTPPTPTQDQEQRL